jgi:hypothetical protein
LAGGGTEEARAERCCGLSSSSESKGLVAGFFLGAKNDDLLADIFGGAGEVR